MNAAKRIFLASLILGIVAACTTDQSIGTTGFMAAWDKCGGANSYDFANCMNRNQNSKYFTPAEKEMVSYFGMIIDQHRRGLLTDAEAKYYLTAYTRNAKAISNQAEAEQAAAIGGAIGAVAGTAAYVADRKCRAAGTC